MKELTARIGYGYFQNNYSVLFDFKKQTVSSFRGSGFMFRTEQNLLKPWPTLPQKEAWQKGISFGSFNKQISYQRRLLVFPYHWC